MDAVDAFVPEATLVLVPEAAVVPETAVVLELEARVSVPTMPSWQWLAIEQW